MTSDTAPGAGQDESKNDPGDWNSSTPSDPATADRIQTSNWTLRTALEFLLGKKFRDGEAREMIAEEVRDAALLMKAAHSGVVEVWKIVLKEVEAVGPDLLKKGLRMTTSHDDLTIVEATGADTVLTAAIDSKEPAMVAEVFRSLQASLSYGEVEKTIDENVARAELLSKAARTGSIDVWKTVVEAVEGHRLLTKGLGAKSRQDTTVLTGAVEGRNPVMVANVIGCVQRNIPNPHQTADQVEQELLEAFRRNLERREANRDEDARVLSCLLHHSVRPSVEDLAALSPKTDKWFEDWCLETVVSADNPFVPGVTLSVLLGQLTKRASESEKQKLVSLHGKVDGLLLEVLERLPKTVRWFPDSVDGCSAVFEPGGPPQNSKWLPGPLFAAFDKRHQLEEFRQAPLIKDFLFLDFARGLPDLADTNDLVWGHNHLGNPGGKGPGDGDGSPTHLNGILRSHRGGSFLKGTDPDFGRLTILPGVQFIAAGIAAKPSRYYRVPAMRMFLDFSVNVGALAFFCALVLVRERDSVTWGEMVLGIYILGGIHAEVVDMLRDFHGYLSDQWHVLDVLGLLFLSGGFVARCVDFGSPWGRCLYALSAPFLFSRTLFFAQILPFQGPLIQVIFNMIREVVQFAVVLVVVLLGFTVSFHILFGGFNTYGETWLHLFKAMLADVEFFDDFPDKQYEAVATVLLVVYLVINAILLLNLLIAVLSTAHAKVQENIEQEYSVLKARLIQRYRLVVGEDLLPAPFNLLQLLLARSKRSQRRAGYVVFWLVVGPVAVCGGAALWVVSAFLVPFPDVHKLGVLTGDERRVGPSVKRGGRVLKVSMCFEHLALFIRRVVVSPLHLFGLWLTWPLACVKRLVLGSCGRSEQGDADCSKHEQVVRVDDVLKAQPGGKSVREILDLIRDPKLEIAEKEERHRKTTEDQMETLHKAVVEIRNLRETVADMGGKLNNLLELVSAQRNPEVGVSR